MDHCGRIIPIIACLAVSVLSGCNRGISERDIRIVSAIEVRTLRVESERNPGRRLVTLIDARASRHYAAGHIPGAVNAQTPDFPEGAALDPDLAAHEHIIVYGRNPGDASARALTKRLLFNGYRGVRLFAGGLDEWVGKGWAVAVAPPSDAAEPDPASNDSEPPSGGGE